MNLIFNLKNKPENISKIGLIYGEAGLGKTKTALYLAIQHDAIYIRATNSMTPKWLLEEIAKELGEIPRFYTADIFRQCVNALKSKPQIMTSERVENFACKGFPERVRQNGEAVIIVDEIDYLLADFRAIESLRDLNDETDSPIILVGMNLAKHKLKKHNHLLDRVSEIYHFEEFDLSDVKQIVNELSEVEITDCTIRAIHSKHKRFRQIVRTIDALEKIAAANELTKIDADMLKEVGYG